MRNRRHFLQNSSLLSLTPVVPAFLTQSAAATKPVRDERLLVVIQLSGGNDGLNTVIPFADDKYRQYRKQLQIRAKDVIRLDDRLGLHPAMKPAGELIQDGRLAIVNGVGYPNPNRSHFRSMAIWHSARMDSEDHNGHGWLGRAADITRQTGSSTPDAVFMGDGSIPAAIVGRRARPIALNNEQELVLASGLSAPATSTHGSDLSAFVHGTLENSFAAAQKFAASAAADDSENSSYPRSRLAQKLKLMAKIIRLNNGTRMFYVEQPGYDTHAAQKFSHEGLLREFSTALRAFLDDMRSCGLGDRVMVLAFSEFGRRVRENASAGTDHGTSGPVFVAGDQVNAGLLGEYPSLSELVDGDLKTTTDFRTVYSSLLTDWLGIPGSIPLSGTFVPQPLIKA